MKLEDSFYKDLVESIPFSICIFNLEREIVYFNNAFSNLFQLQKSNSEKLTHEDISSETYKKVSLFNETLISSKPLSQNREYDCDTTYQVSTVFLNNTQGKKLIVETINGPLKRFPMATKQEKSFKPKIDLVIDDNAMKEILETIHRISQFDSTILITGDSGTGKSVLAKYIHEHSKRSKEPFVTINCGTIPETLIESELFGYTAGAFTGANKKGKAGKVEMADKGTLFLDEIGLLPLHLQTKFLQLIQEKTFTPIGALKSKNVDIRIISATNINLIDHVHKKKFREDLFYRLRVIEFNIPPLRNRQDAIAPLINCFMDQLNSKYNINKTISTHAKELLAEHNWPGNIRELQYVLENLFVTSSTNQITTDELPTIYTKRPVVDSTQQKETLNFTNEVENFERNLLLRVFTEQKSSYKVAKMLGISQSKASRLLRKYQIH